MKKKITPELIKLAWFPCVFILAIICISSTDLSYNYHLYRYSIKPLTEQGLYGIIIFPFVHGSWSHMWGNVFGLLPLLFFIYSYFSSIANLLLLVSWILPGLITWLVGNDSFHIGASGIIYSCAYFVFAWGLLHKNFQYVVFTFVILFLYGSVFFGILPGYQDISWEGHLGGACTGCSLAFLFRNYTTPNTRTETLHHSTISITDKNIKQIEYFIEK